MLLITGITGHSGRYFLQELIRNDYQGKIRFIVRNTSDLSLIEKSNLNYEIATGDLNDEEFLKTCLKDVDTIFHIVNIRYTLKIVKLAVLYNIKRIICVHTTGIYSKYRMASQEYVQIEDELKKIVERENIKLTILRPTMIYGDLCDHNMSKFIKMIDTFRIFPVINHGKCLIQPVNARDLGKAYYSVLMSDSNNLKSEYNLSGDKPISMIDAFKLISENLNKKTIFINCPLGLGVFLAKCLKIATFGKIDYVEKVLRMAEDRDFSHFDAKEDFNYLPEPFAVGIAREVKQYRNRENT
ncbi:MAG: NAD(P)H-binding protein [Clostridiaceae bacterium]|nr:NAD(P)H-binding protein [Clostridiaceae bacterium]